MAGAQVLIFAARRCPTWHGHRVILIGCVDVTGAKGQRFHDRR
jgi:hypothetical protein